MTTRDDTVANIDWLEDAVYDFLLTLVHDLDGAVPQEVRRQVLRGTNRFIGA
jgi:hypothetical protein